MIRHTVVFKLKHPLASREELEFLQTAQKLAAIPTVKNFECLRQISKKNNYDFGLSMEFASVQDYQIYNDHPDHIHFVQTRWIPEVNDFMEIDYELYNRA
jgi:Stress responsive A/B Barrel Domain